MTPQSLVHKQLMLTVSEPWELAGAGAAGRRAIVRSVDDDTARGNLLIEVVPPVDYRGRAYGLFVATSRGRGSLVDALTGGGSAEAGLYGVAGATLPADPYSLDWWRGGLGIVGTLHLAARDAQP